ncbi:MAG: rRNA pseudouridine synthase [Bacteroidetes bacterium]|nr:MAG: rRNA pseudouridine synthase [Bacteroidota bacterium]
MKRKHFKQKDKESFGPSGDKEGGFKHRREGRFKSKKLGIFKPKREGSFKPKREGGFNPDKKTTFYPKRKKGFVSKMKLSAQVKSGGVQSAPLAKQVGENLIRLNKYLANAGICSRREADAFIAAGVITVNGEIITQLGYKISPGDKVQFGGNAVHKEKSVYILLNKPKGYITTCDDPQERETVLDLIHGVKERVYPVGRLDRNTSGLLILTNDGDLAKTLMHPKYQVAKIYNVVLDKPLVPDDFDKIQKGIGLEDGFIKVDDIAYVDGADSRREVGVEIHSGKNRIIRRIFESLGYKVDKLDRVLYASLTKKNLPRGKWRFLEENEVRMLKRIK